MKAPSAHPSREDVAVLATHGWDQPVRYPDGMYGFLKDGRPDAVIYYDDRHSLRWCLAVAPSCCSRGAVYARALSDLLTVLRHC